MSGRDVKKLVLQPRNHRTPPFTAEVPGVERKKGETAPRRNVRTLEQLKSTPEPGVNTVYDILRRSSQKYGDAKAVGKRRLIHLHKEKVKKIIDVEGDERAEKNRILYELSPYEYSSFNEFEQLALRAGYAFRALGLEPKKDRVHIFAATHSNWLATAHGAMSQSLSIVTAYDTLGEDGLTHALAQTTSTAIFLDPHLLVKLINPLKVAKGIEYVIYNDDDALTLTADVENVKADVKKLVNTHSHLAVYSWSDFLKLGEDNQHVGVVPPSPEDLACIMYTSGSTGMPKGVLISHRNVVAAITGVDSIIGRYLGPSDSLLAYLPLAHMLEFVFESACLYWGATKGYGTAKTLFDNSTKKCQGDIAEFKPTILVGVPAVWESVKKGIIAEVGKGSPILRNAFWGAMAAKSFMMTKSRFIPLSLSSVGASVLDNVVLERVAEFMGGRLRMCITGGGPIAKGTQRFISMSIAPMISGYGLTETSAMGAITDPLSWTDEALGEIPGSAEIKLVDYADYISSSNPPKGEIWIRGDSVTSGYLDLERENLEAFSNDGWFKTGDIGEFDSYGQLRIIDRKKNLVKTPNGEYIALEKLESIYRSCGAVSNICVHVGPDQNRPTAIIVPNEPALKQIATDNGIPGSGLGLKDLCCNSKVVDLVLKELQAAGKKGGLAGFEIIKNVVLAEEEWTPQNGLVTSVQKLNRKSLQEKYKEAIYGEAVGVQSAR